MKRIFNILSPVCLVFLIALTLLNTRPIAAQDDTTRYDPATTTIAILPCVDRTGEKVKEWRDRQAGAAYRNAIEQFAQRGFKIADKAEIAKAIADLKLNLDDEEDHRRENFYKVARAVNADLVLFCFVVETREDKKNGGVFGGGDEIQGRATVKTWLLDAKKEQKILSADVKEGKAAGKSKLFGTNEGRGRRVNAVGNAVKEQLEPLLKQYPKVKSVKVDDDGTIKESGA